MHFFECIWSHIDSVCSSDTVNVGLRTPYGLTAFRSA